METPNVEIFKFDRYKKQKHHHRDFTMPFAPKKERELFMGAINLVEIM